MKPSNHNASIDIVLGAVSVLCLETGETWTYQAVTVRRALLLMFFQHGMANYNTWTYTRLFAKYQNRIQLSRSGYTASLTGGCVTYCART